MKTVEEITNIETWKKMNPGLSITSNPFSQQPPDFEIDQHESDRCFQKLTREGYLSTKPIIPEDEVKLIAEAIEKIYQLGLPPIFVYLYDETWQIFRRLSKIVEPILDDDYKITIAGMWAWRIDHTGSGFSIHRDVYANDTREDGRPAHLTVWIPFTDATPENSCMYMLPTHLDPNYPDNMLSKQITNYSDIRAVPAKAGSVLAWNANIAHWGSKSSQWAEHPRISIAMDFSRADADMSADDLAYYASGPDLNPKLASELTFEQRLDAIGEAIWFYKNRVNQNHADKADLLFEFCKSHTITSPEINTTASSPASTTITNNAAENDLDRNNEENNEKNNQQTKNQAEQGNTTNVIPINQSSKETNPESQIRLMPAKKCEIMDSDGQGFGVYATEKIAAKELIEECHIMPAITQKDFNNCSTTFPIESFTYQTKAGVTERVIALGFAGTYRHSTDCNAIWLQHETIKAFQFYALKDIEPGEEIRINYFLGKSAVKQLVPPTKIEVASSSGKGLGVFAIEDIHEGEILEDCEVKQLGGELSRSNSFSDYRFNYPKGVGSKQRVITLGLGGVFNHADDNNAYWINHPHLENVFRFVANRDIAKGEEVCTSYGGASYWEEQGVQPV